MALATDRFLDIRTFTDHMRDRIRVLASTKPVRVEQFILREGHETQSCYWTSQLWARFIRWCLTKRWLQWAIPYPIEALANATEVTTKWIKTQLPENVTSDILAKCAELAMSGKEPTAILVGRQKHYKLLSEARHLCVMPISETPMNDLILFQGLSVQLTNQLEPDSVIVI